MSIPNYLYALANHKGPATVTAGGMSIPVKIMDIQHEHDIGRDETVFKCLVVNEDQIVMTGTSALERLAKQAVNSYYGANSTDYVRQALHAACKKSSPSKAVDPMKIKKVYFNNPVTVVIWADGTKTIVRCQEGDVYSKETGLALCIAKKALGNKSNFNDVFHEWIPEEEEEVKPVIDIGTPLGKAAAKLAQDMADALKGGRHD